MPYMPAGWYAAINRSFGQRLIKRLRETSIVFGEENTPTINANPESQSETVPNPEQQVIHDLKHAVEMHNIYTKSINDYAKELEALGLYVGLTPIYNLLTVTDGNSRVFPVNLVIERRQKIGP